MVLFLVLGAGFVVPGSAPLNHEPMNR